MVNKIGTHNYKCVACGHIFVHYDETSSTDQQSNSFGNTYSQQTYRESYDDIMYRQQLKDKNTAYICWCACFLGFCGIHHFYMGNIVKGIIWLVTGGVCLVGQIIDLFSLGKEVDLHNLRTRQEHQR